MKHLLCALLVACTASSSLLAQTPAADTNVQVIETKIDYPCAMAGGEPVCGPVLAIKGNVDGRTFWMEGGKPKNGLLTLGTYKAHLVQDENHKGYKYNRRYELIVAYHNLCRILFTLNVVYLA